MIFIFSLARSGSTWLGKIFDTHPDVLYLHEPDIADRGLDLLPYWFESAPDAIQIEAARQYLERLMAKRSPRATGVRPFFTKDYRGAMCEYLRRAIIYGAKGIEAIADPAIAERIQIPDLAANGRRQQVVLKSVSALGRAEAFLRTNPSGIQPILLLRDPRAFVTSLLRGKKLGAMERSSRLGALLETRSARHLGLDLSFRPSDDVEAYAWVWLLANMEANAAIDAHQGTQLRYEALARDPEGEARSLFARTGLKWSDATRRFIGRLPKGKDEFYSILRDPSVAANRWRTDLSREGVQRINAIVALHAIGRSYIDE
jgi:hypothetical protein